MGNTSRIFTCLECGRDLTDEYEQSVNKPIICPDCGSTQLKAFLYIKDTLKISDSYKTKLKDSTGFLLQKHVMRRDTSEKMKRPVIITKDIDRRDSKYTIFHHQVKELDEHGILYRIIHEHTEIRKSKRRKV
jgi:DNA-directed RNA polymerase subunit RPC12/RpoP